MSGPLLCACRETKFQMPASGYCTAGCTRCEQEPESGMLLHLQIGISLLVLKSLQAHIVRSRLMRAQAA